MTDSYLPLPVSFELPKLRDLQDNPRLVRGLKMTSNVWTKVDGRILRFVPNYTGSNQAQWVGFIEVVFERDETNDAAR